MGVHGRGARLRGRGHRPAGIRQLPGALDRGPPRPRRRPRRRASGRCQWARAGWPYRGRRADGRRAGMGDDGRRHIGTAERRDRLALRQRL
ncbi:hypothetical protein GTX07_15745, partial [Streptomyces sp. SID5606]|nr:hypothetical protein [Streptomyces sp. SID5606]